MADIRCPSCGSESVSRDPTVEAGRDIPLMCDDCGTRWVRTPQRSCPRCGSTDFTESAVDGWAFDDLEEARDNPATTQWAYVDKLVFRCLRCRHEWESVEGTHPYRDGSGA
jgi:transcription elongation factor Elf1